MSQLTEKRCPLCGCYIKLHTGDVHSCSSCPFKCFGDDFDRLCKAMKAQAELDALKAAVLPVVDWWKSSPDGIPVRLAAHEIMGLMTRKEVSQLDELAKLVLPPLQTYSNQYGVCTKHDLD